MFVYYLKGRVTITVKVRFSNSWVTLYMAPRVRTVQDEARSFLQVPTCVQSPKHSGDLLQLSEAVSKEQDQKWYIRDSSGTPCMPASQATIPAPPAPYQQ